MTHAQRLAKYKLPKTTIKTLDEEDPLHFAVRSIANHLTEIKIADPMPPIDKGLFDTVMDTLPAAEDTLSPKLPFRPMITISTLLNILKLYNVDLIPTHFAEGSDASP